MRPALATSLRAYSRQLLADLPVVAPVARYLVRRTYDRTVLGLWLVLLRALLPAATLALVFPQVESFQTAGLPYPAFLFVGMSFWILVDVGIGQGIRSLYHARLIRRFVGVPSFLVVVAALALPLVYGAILVLASALALAVTGSPFALDWNLLAVPGFVMLALMLVSGINAILSVSFMVTRDIRFVAPVMTHAWFFATPVFYPLSALPPAWQSVSLYLNPLSPVIEAMRFCVFGVGAVHILPLLVSVVVIAFVFLFGIWFMMRSEWVLPEIS